MPNDGHTTAERKRTRGSTPRVVLYLWCLIPLGLLGGVLTLGLLIRTHYLVNETSQQATEIDQAVLGSMSDISETVEQIKANFRHIFHDQSESIASADNLIETGDIFMGLEVVLSDTLETEDECLVADTERLRELYNRAVRWRRDDESLKEHRDQAWERVRNHVTQLRASLDSHEGLERIRMIVATKELASDSAGEQAHAVQDVLANLRDGPKLSQMKTELSDLLFKSSQLMREPRAEILGSIQQNEIAPSIERVKDLANRVGTHGREYLSAIERIEAWIDTAPDSPYPSEDMSASGGGLYQLSVACLQSEQEGQWLVDETSIVVDLLEQSIAEHSRIAMAMRSEATQNATAVLRSGVIGVIVFGGIIGFVYVMLTFKVAGGVQNFVRELRESHRELEHAHEVGMVANHELQASMEVREALQTQLHEAQRLESIGQLAAGIAHEINTPAQYVSDNTRFLQTEFASLIRVLDRYADMLDQGQDSMSWEDRAAGIEATLQEVDYEFLREEIPLAIEQSLEGVGRITNIVKAMKDFSHPGSDQKEPADINSAIQSTVMVCSNRWKYAANVEFDLDPNLGPVPCFVAEFNQVILNLIVNAADAIELKNQGSDSKGTIRISTARREGCVHIEVRDNGSGIPDSVRTRIFEPFFTTKDVGKGTGQGLSISRDVIVGKHGGSMLCESVQGIGTSFTIMLPLELDASCGDQTEREAA